MRTWPTNSMSCRRAPWSSSGRRAQGKTTCARAIASRLERSFVEVLPSQRAEDQLSPLQGVTNELLKMIPAFLGLPGRQLVCATNLIRALDTEFLRRGRFDCVIPHCLPNRQAPEDMWQRFIPAVAVDSKLLVERTEGFSTADIEIRRTKHFPAGAGKRCLRQ